MDESVDEEDILDEDLEFTYGSKKKLEEDVENGDIEVEDALFLEGYQEDED